MTKSISIRLPDELATRIEEDAKAAGNSLNAQVIQMLESAKSTVANPIVLSVRIERDLAMKSIKYHAEESLGLDPVISSARDLEHWAKYIILEVSGFDEGETDIGVVADDKYVVITGNIEIIEAIKMYIL